MMRFYLIALCGLVSLPLCGDVYFPESDALWEERTPREAGADGGLLTEAVAYAGAAGSDALVVLHGGRIVVERYWNGTGRETKLPLFSASKPMVASVVGKLLEVGYFASLEQPASEFLVEWQGEPQKEAITLRQHLSMTTGLEGGEANLFLALMANSERFFAANLPMAHAPGAYWTYNNPAYRLLFPIIEAATGTALPEVFGERLFEPLGMSGVEWVKRTMQVGSVTVTNYQYIRATALSAARFGLVALREGSWNGQPVIPSGFLEEAVTPSQALNPSYGYLWWLNGGAQSGGHQQLFDGLERAGPYFPDAPPDAVAALGKDDQMIVVIPSLDLVVVRLGRSPLGTEGTEAVSPEQDVLLGKIARAFGYTGQEQELRTELELDGGQMRVSWATWVGRSYELLTSVELAEDTFDSLHAEPVAGDGLPIEAVYPQDGPVRFFQVRAGR